MMTYQQVDLKKEELEACLAFQANNFLQELQVGKLDQSFYLGDNITFYQNSLLQQQQQQQQKQQPQLSKKKKNK